MKFDFTSILDRTNRDALAVDVIPIPGAQVQEGFDKIPMWVADMNFPTAPSIQDAIIARASHPAFGYFHPSEAYYDAIIRWQETQNGVIGLQRENIGYENGVLGAVVSALNVFCSRGDRVLVHAPTYVGFSKILADNGYRIETSPLVPDSAGVWRMDYADMEQRIRKYKIHAAIFCSPHNPCGRVWERAELEQAIALFRKYDVQIVSDEIWSDLTLNGYYHIPVQSVSDYAREHTVAVYAPSKTFNLAGLVGSYHIIYNTYLRERYEREQSLSHYNSMNVLSMHALIGAYSETGRAWLNELRGVLTENTRYACDFIRRSFPGVSVASPEGTYMLFLDCTQWCKAHQKTLDELLTAGVRVGVIWQDGRSFYGPCHIRMNLALPHSRVQEAFRRLKDYVFLP